MKHEESDSDHSSGFVVMKKFLTKLNFIIGIVSVLITFIPGKLIGK